METFTVGSASAPQSSWASKRTVSVLTGTCAPLDANSPGNCTAGDISPTNPAGSPLYVQFLDQFRPHTQGGDRRAEIMRDGGHHVRAVLHEAFEACPHVVERSDRLLDIQRPLLDQWLHCFAATEAVRRQGKTCQRPGDTPYHEDHEPRKDQGCQAKG